MFKKKKPTKKLKKREWFYVLLPTAYEMRCDHCWKGELEDGTGKNITWSEYEGKIWCYDCEVDTDGTGGILDGPISLHLSSMLGITFDRFNIKKNCIEKLNLNKFDETGELVWDDATEVTKRLLRGEDCYGDGLRKRASKYFEIVDGKVRGHI